MGNCSCTFPLFRLLLLHFKNLKNLLFKLKRKISMISCHNKSFLLLRNEQQRQQLLQSNNDTTPSSSSSSSSSSSVLPTSRSLPLSPPACFTGGIFRLGFCITAIYRSVLQCLWLPFDSFMIRMRYDLCGFGFWEEPSGFRLVAEKIVGKSWVNIPFSVFSHGLFYLHFPSTLTRFFFFFFEFCSV
jgi:hypothetical protein